MSYAPAAILDPPTGLPVKAWASVVVLGLACTALAFVVFLMLISEAGPTRPIVITYVNPAVAITLGVILLDERVTTGMVVGFPLILLESILATTSLRRLSPLTEGPAAEPAV